MFVKREGFANSRLCLLYWLTHCDSSTTVTEWRGNYFRRERTVHETWNLFRFILHSEHLHSFNLCCLLCSLTRWRRFFLHPLNVPFSLHVHKFKPFFFSSKLPQSPPAQRSVIMKWVRLFFFLHQFRPIELLALLPRQKSKKKRKEL